MRSFQRRLLLFLTVLSCLSCSIDDYETKSNEEYLQQYTEQIGQSSFRIVDFTENELDLTDSYTNFVFSFDSVDDKVTVTALSFSNEAPWLFYLDADSAFTFQMNFGNDALLERLNGDWSIDIFLEEQFTLYRKDVSSGVVRYLTFQKI
ncbi:hypothetical protein [Flavobacterium aurantiibacter]|uniref:Lipoprotein n=1 Tax=Flavobacterium aurantiibacter TaxID=2023067 RepID=A0A255ZQM3_9FLAO|nr:hypothetical protein [Flavobacterium aurantiibacter]OYQ43721.1 hypothetical protein CHX27_09070 [Flavobacterium aurantiibacter]